jgi:hypothetical protein
VDARFRGKASCQQEGIMLISGLFASSRHAAAADGLQARAARDPRSAESWRPDSPAFGENCRDKARRPPRVGAIVADWWPLLVAGVAIALLI